jgi:hypothetical protein
MLGQPGKSCPVCGRSAAGGKFAGAFDQPDNIAPVALYLASERSDWLTGRVISSAGFEVGLYENPQIIRQLSAPGPWEYGKLAKAIEKSFRPAANGLPDSLFASQLSTS